MNIDLSKLDLDKPYTSFEGKSLEDISVEKNSGEPKEENGKEVEKENKEKVESESSVEDKEETQVPYSRFKKIHQRAIQAERENEEMARKTLELENRLNSNKQKEEPQAKETNLPAWWVNMFGNSEDSAYGYNELMGKVGGTKEDIIKELKEAERNQEKEFESNESDIEDNLDVLSGYIGREMSWEEQERVLNIIDKYSPIDEKTGKYIKIFPFEDAWEIYQDRQKALGMFGKKARNEIAGLVNRGSSGEPDFDKAESDKNFNPLARGTWRDKLKDYN